MSKATRSFLQAERGLIGVGSWDEFCALVAPLENKGKGDAFELLVKLYLTLDPKYRTQLRHVWLYHEVPKTIRELLNLPEKDKGIDLVAEALGGEFWAIQAKYRTDTTASISWGEELSTFVGLAFGVCRNVRFGLVCSTTEEVTEIVQGLPNIGIEGSDVWRGLDGEFFGQIQEFLGGKAAPPLEPRTPKPHQGRAVAKAVAHYVAKGERRGKLISPCGSGKSLTAYWIAEALKARKIVVAVPSLSLIRQTLTTWLRELIAAGKEAPPWICVCSDESAGDPDLDDAITHVHNLGVPCLTDRGEIAAKLRASPDGIVVFTTYQSGPALGAAVKEAGFRFDLGVFDEAHKTVGRRDKIFSHLLFDENVGTQRRLFMTATERQYRGDSDEIVSMDDSEMYGEAFEVLTFKEAIEQGILCDYEIVTIAVRHQEIAELIETNAFVKPDKGEWRDDVEARALAAVVALRKAMERHPIRHAVSFHSSIRRAETFRADYESASSVLPGPVVETFHVSSKVPTGTRARALEDFAKSERALITNARCLTEGVDVPGIDCVFFADARQSKIDNVQATGRALRPATATGKKKGYVILPLLVEDGATPMEVSEGTAFKAVMGVLRDLGSNDERIVEYFRSIANGKRPNNGSLIHFDDIDVKDPAHLDIGEFAKAIELACWGRLGRLAEEDFTYERVKEAMVAYQRVHGRLPKCHTPGEVPGLPGETWSRIDGALCGNRRGVDKWPVSYRSIADFQAKVFGTRNIMDLDDLDAEKVEDAMAAYRDAHGGGLPEYDTPGEVSGLPGEKWLGIDYALRRRKRGTDKWPTRYDSLADFKAKVFGTRNKKNLDALEHEEVKDAMAAFRDAHGGDLPTSQTPGEVPGLPGETWLGIESALKVVGRGVDKWPVRYKSLADFKAKVFGAKNIMDMDDLDHEKVKKAISAYRDAHFGDLPKRETAGEVPGLSGETWSGINSALQREKRGTDTWPTRYASLADLHAKVFGAKNHMGLVDLDHEKVKDAMAAFRDAHGGALPKSETPDEVMGLPGETWSGINSALQRGGRGTDKWPVSCTSLADFKKKVFGARNKRDLDDLDHENVKKAMSAYRDAHAGELPRRKTPGEVPGLSGETWSEIDSALATNRRGVDKWPVRYKSIADFNERVFGARNRWGQDDLDHETIKTAMSAYRDAHGGELPGRRTPGEVPGLPGETWLVIDRAFVKNGRGLGKEPVRYKSLADFKAAVFGVRSHLDRDDLDYEKVKKAMSAYMDAHSGELPKRDTPGEVPGLPGETWMSLNTAFKTAGRGVDKWPVRCRSIADFRAKAFGVRNERDLDDLDHETLKKAMATYRDAHGDLPRSHAPGEVPGLPGETWSAIENAFRRKRRGVDKWPVRYKSLADFKAKVFGRRNHKGLDGLDHKTVEEAARTYRAAHGGALPKRDTPGEVPGLPGETWSRIDSAFTTNGRGVDQWPVIYKSLADFAAKVFGARNKKDLDDLDHEKVKRAISAYRDAHGGKMPTQGTPGEVPGLPGETWPGINAALYAVGRGVDKWPATYKSLADFKAKVFGARP